MCTKTYEKSPNFIPYTIISPFYTGRPASQICFTQNTKNIIIFYMWTNFFLTVNCVAKEFFGPMKIYPRYLNFSPKIVQIFQARIFQTKYRSSVNSC